MKRSVGTLALALAIASPAAAETILRGPARILDADTIAINGTRVRLKGIDAAERGSLLGEAARLKMMAIAQGEITCELTGEKTHRREVGYCTTAAGVDIARALIESGFALSCPRYSTRYVAFERPSARAVQARARYCLER